MATLHKFVDGTPTSLTVNTLSNYILNYSSYSYWIPSATSGTTLQYIDVTNVKNKSIEIVLSYEVSSYGFVSHPDFTSNTTHCQVIPAPTPTVVDGKYHYVFPPNTFTYNRVAGIGAFQKNSGSNHYFYAAAMYSATSGLPTWEDVDIPEFNSSKELTPKTVEGYGGTTYLSTYIIYYPPTSTQKPFMSGYSNSQGKIRYFELPPGDGKFKTNAVYYAFVADAIAYSQKVQELTATSISGSKRTWDAGPSDTTRYILITASVPSTAGNIATNTTMGTASVSNVWGTGTIHARTSGSWT